MPKPSKRSAATSSAPPPTRVARGNPTSKRKAPSVVVGVGASGPGVQEFVRVLHHIPHDIGVTFVFSGSMPASPDRVGIPALLDRNTGLRVKEVKGSTKIFANHIYVLRPGARAEFLDGTIKAVRAQKGDTLPMDAFFGSLARRYGNHAVAVLLGSDGIDGVTGLGEVKAEGGITVLQQNGDPINPATVSAVDLVLSADEIAAEVRRIAEHTGVRKLSDSIHEKRGGETQLNRIFALLRALSGVNFSFYKRSTLTRRIYRRMTLHRIADLKQYAEHLQQNPAELDLLFADLLINVTSFFRDKDVFEALRQRVFPSIVKGKDDNANIRFWIPGCSTGEEVYSIAIAFYEFLGRTANARSIQFFATDVSDAALAKARAGFYPDAATAHIAAPRLRKFFEKVEGGYCVAKFIRDSCIFARQNVVEDPPFSKVDLVSCRNVMIYFGSELQKKVVPMFHYALKENGHLLLGSSETIGAFGKLFTLVDKRSKIYIKRNADSKVRMAQMPYPAPTAPVAPAPPVPAGNDVSAYDLHRQVDRVVLAHYSPAGVVVNQALEVVHFRGETKNFLEHPPGDVSFSILKLVRPDLLLDLRTILSRAAKTDTVARKECVAFTGGRRVTVVIKTIPFRTTGNDRFFLILFEQGLPLPKAPGRIPVNASGRGSRELMSEISRLKEESRGSKESLQIIIEEHEATNEELKSANEEIQSSNEELQSTNEELETAKEELQATNEELTTLNEELQQRNQDISHVNNDLSNLLSSVNLPILILSSDLTIRRYTPSAERVFNLISTDVGRRITDINPHFSIPSLAQWVREVMETLAVRETEVQAPDGRWHSLRIRPYRTVDNKIDGAVVMLVDINDIKLALLELTSVAAQPVLTLSANLHIKSANRAFLQQFKFRADEIENCSVFALRDGAWDVPQLRLLLESLLPATNRVDDHVVEAKFVSRVRQKFACSARRLQQPGNGVPVIVLAFSLVQAHESKKSVRAKAPPDAST